MAPIRAKCLAFAPIRLAVLGNQKNIKNEKIFETVVILSLESSTVTNVYYACLLSITHILLSGFEILWSDFVFVCLLENMGSDTIVAAVRENGCYVYFYKDNRITHSKS